MIRKIFRAIQDPVQAAVTLPQLFHRKEVARKKAALDLNEERRRSIEFLSRHFNCDAAAYFSELQTSGFIQEFQVRYAELQQQNPLMGSSNTFDCETLYLLVRSRKPKRIVETGVLHGAFSAFILYAQDLNGGGELFSFDLPARRADAPPKDFLVPDRLKGRNRLILGDTSDTLPRHLKEIGTIDHFNHDSLHTFEHMTWEYLMGHRYLAPGGVLTSHDIFSSRAQPNAFPVVMDALGYQADTFRNFGIGIKPEDS